MHKYILSNPYFDFSCHKNADKALKSQTLFSEIEKSTVSKLQIMARTQKSQLKGRFKKITFFGIFGGGKLLTSIAKKRFI